MAHLHTGEPVWLHRYPKDLWRVTSIPLSTDRIRYGDIVRLKTDANGIPNIDAVEKRAGYSTAIILEYSKDRFPHDLIAQFDGLVPWERIDRDKIAVTLTEDTHKKTCDLIDASGLRAFRLAKFK